MLALLGRRLEPRHWPQRTVQALGVLLLAWILATQPLPEVTLLLLTGAGGVLLLRWPWLAWLGLAAVLPFASSVKLGPLSLADLALAGAAALWFADGARRGSLRLDPTPLLGLVLLYLGALLLGLLPARELGEALAEVAKWAEVLLVIGLVGQVLGVERGAIPWLVGALLAGAALEGLLGVYQFLFRVGPEAFLLFDRFMRASGTFRQPNPFAGYLGLSLPVAVSLAIWAWQRAMISDTPAWRRLLVPLLASGAAGAMGAGLLASWSRGGWLGALVGVGAVVILRSRRTLALAGLGLLLLAGLGLLGGLQPERIPAPLAQRLADLPTYFGGGDVLEQPITDENFAVIERVAHWVAALRMWERAPWLGVGPGNYATVYPEVKTPPWDDPLGHAHNIYLNVLAETGLVGLAAYLLLWVGVTVWLVRRWRQAPASSWERAFLLGLLGVVGHLTVHNLFDNLYVQGIPLHLALWLGAAQALERRTWQGSVPGSARLNRAEQRRMA